MTRRAIWTRWQMRRIACWMGWAAAAAWYPAYASETIPSADVPGAEDHPIVSRFAGSVIVAKKSSDYDSLVFPLGPSKGWNTDAWQDSVTVEGRLTRIVYATPPGKSVLEVIRNYQQSLASAGFDIAFECAGAACSVHGANEYVSRHRETARNAALDWKKSDLVRDLMEVDDDQVQALTAHLVRPAGDVYVHVMATHQESEQDATGVLLEVVEVTAMDAGQVTVDADAMSKGLAAEGHIALYGITFATDSAALEPGSGDTLASIAALMNGDPELEVYIVGHTDNTGDLSHNLALSQRRAEAVVAALQQQHGVDAARMMPRGLASFAPVASNAAESGRAANRRVELVQQ